jgi:hypothetical protein
MSTNSPVPSPNLLTRLSASPASSTSSLTSSSSFDPHADPSLGESSKSATEHVQVLGLRELARMRRHERRARKEANKPTQGRNEVRLISVIGPETDLPFAKEVEIKGWRVVGGKSWTDLGRIGAYVGQSTAGRVVGGADILVYDIEVTLRSVSPLS